VVKAEVVLEDVSVGENGAKAWIVESIPLHGQGLNYRINVCELKDLVGEKGWSLNWVIKLGFVKKPFPASFLSRLLENV